MARKRKTRRTHDGGGSVFQQPDGTWRAQVAYHVWVDMDGQQVRRRRYLNAVRSTRADAELARVELCRERDDLLRRGGPRERQRLAAYLAWWQATVLPQRDLKRAAIADYEYAIKRVVPILGDRWLDELEATDGDELVLALRDRLAPRTLHKTIRVLNDALNGAVKRKKLKANPFLDLDLPKVPKYHPVILNTQAVPRFREAVAGHRWALVYDVLLYTGMREGEVLAMQWANLDWRTGAYRLTHDLDRDTFELDTLKTDAARRTVYLPRELLARLGEHKLEHDMLKESDPTWNPLNLVFCTSVGTAIRPNNLWRHFKAVCRLLGFPPNTTVHHLRHTWRHHAADRMDAATMRDWLGHTETDTTLAVYGEGVSDRAKRRAGVELDRLYEED